MFKIPSKTSVTISMILSIIFFAVLIAGAAIMPWLSNTFCTMSVKVFTTAGRVYVLVLGYLVIFFMAVADMLVYRLLNHVKSGNVFTGNSVSCIRGISWCAFALCVIFALLGIYFYISFFIAFACLFFGLCLRVVKNVIEEATAIKNENDFTI